MKYNEILQLLPKQIQALYTDSILFFSDEASIATPERKSLILDNIKKIKEQIAALEQLL